MERGTYLRQFYLNKLKELPSNMVECEEFKSGKRWVVSEEVFKKFRRSGFPIVPEPVNNIIHDLFKNKNYKEMATKEKQEIIDALLMLASQ